MKRIKGLLIILYCTFFLTSARIKDIARFDKISSQELVGYGLVVGLPGTGDRNLAATQKAMENMLNNFGLQLNESQLKSRNAASVMVTARVSGIFSAGQKIDVNISSLGDAMSLDQGSLIRTPLYDKKGNIVAVAQGSVATGKKKNSAIISSGAEIISDYFDEAGREGLIELYLNRPDYKTAVEIEKKLNSEINGVFAKAENSSKVTVSYSTESFKFAQLAALIAETNVETSRRSRIIVNSLSGDIVINGDVFISPCAVSVGDIEIEIGRKSDDPESKSFYFEGASARDFMKALGMLKLKPHQMVEVIKTLNSAGVLSAEVEII